MNSPTVSNRCHTPGKAIVESHEHGIAQARQFIFNQFNLYIENCRDVHKRKLEAEKLKALECKRLEQVLKMRKTKQEIRREATWFKIAFIGIGFLIGVPVGGLLHHLSVGQNTAVSSPVEQISGK
ncbi:hypothetical protein [Acaryochloris marina]|uniref:Uncharacterized protein n=1 Tax=Acaryochloris marina (strain MBIC 11017) TaxID=329726 RepID=A8ZMR5_ACAM1|nr:hypothetical protein [Acaryochloris marina]ABW32476.1 hypothetical protein AM1_C0173 [Acaryochloris marina MBIC11017]